MRWSRARKATGSGASSSGSRARPAGASRRGDIGGIVRRARAQNYTAPSLDDLEAARRLLPTLRAGEPSYVVFDHNMGGGANQYRRQWIAERIAGGAVVLLCTYNLPTLDYRLEVLRPGGGEEIFRLSSFLGLEPVLAQATVAEIFVNSPVSFDEPLLFADWIAAMRAAHPQGELTIAAHDYFVGLPVLRAAQCRWPLLRHPGPRRVRPMPAAASGAATSRCRRRPRSGRGARSGAGASPRPTKCAASRSRRARLLARAYPELDPARVSVVPHRVDYVPARLPALDHAAPLVIGVIGQISEQKGALVVKELLAEIDREHPGRRVSS